MSKFSQLAKEVVDEGLLEKENIKKSRHKVPEKIFLWVRNVLVAVAAVIFIFSIIMHNHEDTLKGIAYFCGAGAYVSEIIIATDIFTRKLNKHELFMAFCFGPLYILLGLSYILDF